MTDLKFDIASDKTGAKEVVDDLKQIEGAAEKAVVSVRKLKGAAGTAQARIKRDLKKMFEFEARVNLVLENDMSNKFAQIQREIDSTARLKAKVHLEFAGGVKGQMQSLQRELRKSAHTVTVKADLKVTNPVTQVKNIEKVLKEKGLAVKIKARLGFGSVAENQAKLNGVLNNLSAVKTVRLKYTSDNIDTMPMDDQLVKRIAAAKRQTKMAMEQAVAATSLRGAPVPQKSGGSGGSGGAGASSTVGFVGPPNLDAKLLKSLPQLADRMNMTMQMLQNTVNKMSKTLGIDPYKVSYGNTGKNAGVTNHDRKTISINKDLAEVLLSGPVKNIAAGGKATSMSLAGDSGLAAIKTALYHEFGHVMTENIKGLDKYASSFFNAYRDESIKRPTSLMGPNKEAFPEHFALAMMGNKNAHHMAKTIVSAMKSKELGENGAARNLQASVGNSKGVFVSLPDGLTTSEGYAPQLLKMLKPLLDQSMIGLQLYTKGKQKTLEQFAETNKIPLKQIPVNYRKENGPYVLQNGKDWQTHRAYQDKLTGAWNRLTPINNYHKNIDYRYASQKVSNKVLHASVTDQAVKNPRIDDVVAVGPDDGNFNYRIDGLKKQAAYAFKEVTEILSAKNFTLRDTFANTFLAARAGSSMPGVEPTDIQRIPFDDARSIRVRNEQNEAMAAYNANPNKAGLGYTGVVEPGNIRSIASAEKSNTNAFAKYIRGMGLSDLDTLHSDINGIIANHTKYRMDRVSKTKAEIDRLKYQVNDEGLGRDDLVSTGRKYDSRGISVSERMDELKERYNDQLNDTGREKALNKFQRGIRRIQDFPIRKMVSPDNLFDNFDSPDLMSLLGQSRSTELSEIESIINRAPKKKSSIESRIKDPEKQQAAFRKWYESRLETSGIDNGFFSESFEGMAAREIGGSNGLNSRATLSALNKKYSGPKSSVTHALLTAMPEKVNANHYQFPVSGSRVNDMGNVQDFDWKPQVLTARDSKSANQNPMMHEYGNDGDVADNKYVPYHQVPQMAEKQAQSLYSKMALPAGKNSQPTLYDANGSIKGNDAWTYNPPEYVQNNREAVTADSVRSRRAQRLSEKYSFNRIMKVLRRERTAFKAEMDRHKKNQARYQSSFGPDFGQGALGTSGVYNQMAKLSIDDVNFSDLSGMAPGMTPAQLNTEGVYNSTPKRDPNRYAQLRRDKKDRIRSSIMESNEGVIQPRTDQDPKFRRQQALENYITNDSLGSDRGVSVRGLGFPSMEDIKKSKGIDPKLEGRLVEAMNTLGDMGNVEKLNKRFGPVINEAISTLSNFDVSVDKLKDKFDKAKELFPKDGKNESNAWNRAIRGDSKKEKTTSRIEKALHGGEGSFRQNFNQLASDAWKSGSYENERKAKAEAGRKNFFSIGGADDNGPGGGGTGGTGGPGAPTGGGPNNNGYQPAPKAATQKQTIPGSAFMSKFAEFGMIMSGLAATMFVIQMVASQIAMLAKPFMNLEASIVGMRVATDGYSAGARGMATQAAGINTFSAAEHIEAQTVLSSRGMDTGLATKALKMAKDPALELKDAVMILQLGFDDLTDSAMKTSNAMEGSLSESWGLMTSQFKGFNTSMFSEFETGLKGFFDGLSSWASENQAEIKKWAITMVDSIGGVVSIFSHAGPVVAILAKNIAIMLPQIVGLAAAFAAYKSVSFFGDLALGALKGSGALKEMCDNLWLVYKVARDTNSVSGSLGATMMSIAKTPFAMGGLVLGMAAAVGWLIKLSLEARRSRKEMEQLSTMSVQDFGKKSFSDRESDLKKIEKHIEQKEASIERLQNSKGNGAGFLGGIAPIRAGMVTEEVAALEAQNKKLKEEHARLYKKANPQKQMLEGMGYDFKKIDFKMLQEGNSAYLTELGVMTDIQKKMELVTANNKRVEFGKATGDQDRANKLYSEDVFEINQKEAVADATDMTTRELSAHRKMFTDLKIMTGGYYEYRKNTIEADHNRALRYTKDETLSKAKQLSDELAFLKETLAFEKDLYSQHYSAIGVMTQAEYDTELVLIKKRANVRTAAIEAESKARADRVSGVASATGSDQAAVVVESPIQRKIVTHVSSIERLLIDIRDGFLGGEKDKAVGNFRAPLLLPGMTPAQKAQPVVVTPKADPISTKIHEADAKEIEQLAASKRITDAEKLKLQIRKDSSAVDVFKDFERSTGLKIDAENKLSSKVTENKRSLFGMQVNEALPAIMPDAKEEELARAKAQILKFQKASGSYEGKKKSMAADVADGMTFYKDTGVKPGILNKRDKLRAEYIKTLQDLSTEGGLPKKSGITIPKELLLEQVDSQIFDQDQIIKHAIDQNGKGTFKGKLPETITTARGKRDAYELERQQIVFGKEGDTASGISKDVNSVKRIKEYGDYRSQSQWERDSEKAQLQRKMQVGAVDDKGLQKGFSFKGLWENEDWKTKKTSEIELLGLQQADEKESTIKNLARAGTWTPDEGSDPLGSLEDQYKSKLDLNEEFLAMKTAQEVEADDLGLKHRKITMDATLSLAGNMASGWGNIFGQMYEMSGKKHKEFFILQKAMALAQIAINTAVAVSSCADPIKAWAIPAIISLGAAQAAVVTATAIAGYADGGEIGGSSPHSRADNLTIRATAGEWMQPVSSVSYYGRDVMSAMQKRQIPREVFSGLKPASNQTPSSSFSDGGYIGTASAPAGVSQPIVQGTASASNRTEYIAPINVTVSNNNSGQGESDPAADKKQAADMNQLLVQTVRKTIADEQRPGGILNR